MDTEFIKYLSSMGVGGVIAGLIFIFYRKDIKSYTELWKIQSEMLMAVVKDNTAAMTSSIIRTVVITSLCALLFFISSFTSFHLSDMQNILFIRIQRCL